MGQQNHKMVFFSKGDNKFLNEIIESLSAYFDTRLITISSTNNYKLIDQYMNWSHICWFEWCDDLIVYASNLEIATKRIIVCRLHSYEAFTSYPARVNWKNVDRLIFVSDYIRNYVTVTFKINPEITTVIPNGVQVEKLNFRERTAGYKVAYMGYINYKKGPMLLLQTFKAVYDRDPSYKLYIAGRYQDPRYQLYFNQMVKEFGLESSFFFEGWQADIDSWLEDKDYIICSSVLESQNMSVMQAMAKGIKPVIHNFAGAKEIYPEKYVWNTISEAVAMITDKEYNSREYRNFIQERYSLEQQNEVIKKNIYELLNNTSKVSSDVIIEKSISDGYPKYLNDRMNIFISYRVDDFDEFNFNDACILLGKIDKSISGYKIIEFIIRDKQNKLLILNNIWKDESSGLYILPHQMKKSINYRKIINLCNEILTLDINYTNNIGGFILDSSIQEEVRKNYIAYIWERGIPGSQFLPMANYLKIAERYIFASDFINRYDNVLEAPCGFGYGAAYLSRHCKEVYALDIAEENIAFSRQAFRQNNIKWTTGDVTALPYNDSNFDAYVSFEVFEHLPVDTAKRQIEEAYRVLKNGGRFIISTPNREMRKNVKNPFHVKEYDFNEFNEILKGVFKNVDLYSMVGYRIEKGTKDSAHVMIGVCQKD